MTKRRREPKQEKTGHERPVRVGLDFDSAIQRAVKVTPPGEGTNQDYVKANEKHDRKR